MDVLYLHGFGSSPQSGKAGFLAGKFAGHGIELLAPDLNHPDFSTLTVTRMLDQVDDLIDTRPPAPVVLIGSSLGGFVALHTAERRASRPDSGHPVTRLVLLAPALDFGNARDPLLIPENVEAWRATDRWDVFHNGYGCRVPVHFALWEDAGRYDALETRVAVPTLVIHGTKDTVVDLSTVRRFAGPRAHVTLRVLDTDHQLQGTLDVVWEEIARFLSLGGQG